MKERDQKKRSRGLDRRSVLKAAGGFTIAASFAGCSASSGNGSQGSGNDSGGNNQEETPIGDSSNSVEINGFKVPNKNVVPASKLSKNQKLRTLNLIVPPKATRPNDYQAMQIFAKQWSKLGIDVNVQIKTSTVRLNQAWTQNEPPQKGNAASWWDISYWYFSPRPGRNDPDTLLYNLYQPSEEDRYNFVFFENDKVNRLVDKQRQQIDKKKRQKIVKKAQAAIHKVAPYNFYYWPSLLIPWNQNKWENWVTISGLGSRNMVSHSQLKPKTNDKDLVALQPLNDQIKYLAPFGINGTSGEMQSRVMWERLAWPGKDGQPEPRLAREFNYKDDTTLEVPIRKDSRWTDGTKTLAEDVKFTYDQNKKQNTTFSSVVEPIKNVEIADDYRLIFHLKRPFAPIKTVAFARLGIAQKKHWSEIFNSKEFKSATIEAGFWLPNKFVTNGPLKFKDMDKQTYITLERFDDHWDPIAYDSRITRFVKSTSSALNQLQDGSADTLVIYGGDKGALKQLVDKTDKLTLTSGTSNTAHFVAMNNDQPPFQLNAFRQAVHHCIPKKKLFNQIFNGYGEYGAGNTSVSPAIDFWYNDNLTQKEFSLQAAANRLVEGGFMWDKSENKLWMPEDGWYLTKKETAPARKFGFSRQAMMK